MITEAHRPARSVDEVIAALLEAARPIDEIEHVATPGASGRVLAADIEAVRDLPACDNSSADGYAFASADVSRALATGLRIEGRYPAGAHPGSLAPGCAARVFTGSCLPAGADRVAMQEDCVVSGDRIRFTEIPAAGDNVRRRGEDIKAGDRILQCGSRLRAQDIGVAAALGRADLPVYRRLRVAVLCTGDELVAPSAVVSDEQVFDANGALLTGLLATQGCEVAGVRHVTDDLERTVGVLTDLAAEADVLITTGGASVGEEDHLRPAVARCGQLAWWKVAIKPGKPFTFGSVRGRPLLGLPGNPTSALVTFCILVRPFLRKMQGMRDLLPMAYRLPAKFGRPAGPRREYLRVRIEREGDDAGLVLAGPQGSGILSTAVRAHGLAVMPEGRPVRDGDCLDFYPFDQLLS